MCDADKMVVFFLLPSAKKPSPIQASQKSLNLLVLSRLDHELGSEIFYSSNKIRKTQNKHLIWYGNLQFCPKWLSEGLYS